jgi:transcription factor C subunit 3
LTVEAIGSALSPHLEPFEIRLIVQWGQKAGVLRDLDMGMGITVEEWWWLAVPWQDQRVTTKTKH